MRNCRDVMRIQSQQRQPIYIFMRDMLQQIGLVNSSEQVSPNCMLIIGESNLLVFSSVFPARIKMLLGDVPRIDWRILIFSHSLHLSNNRHPSSQSLPWENSKH